MENPPQPNPQDNVENPPQPNPQQSNPQPNPNPEGEQDRNSYILTCLALLRSLSSSIRGGDLLRQYLADALDTITNTIANAQGALYNITSYRESRRQYFCDGLSYKDIKDLKFTTNQFFSLF